MIRYTPKEAALERVAVENDEIYRRGIESGASDSFLCAVIRVTYKKRYWLYRNLYTAHYARIRG